MTRTRRLAVARLAVGRAAVAVAPRRLAAAVLAVAMLVPAPAGAAAKEQQGWWWRAQTGVLVEVPRPDVPEGGLYVEGAPDGPSAVAALRFALASGEVAERLTLKVAEERGGDQAVLLACPAGARWQPAQGGRWDNRPQAGCEGQGVLGARAEDGTAWTFNLSLWAARDALDLVLVPGTDDTRPAGVNGSVFSVAFEAPEATALVVRTTASDPGRDDFGGDSGPPVPPYQPPPLQPVPPSTEAGPPEPAPPVVQDPSVIPPKITPRRQTSAAAPSRGGGKDARALATLIALLSVGAAGVLSRDRLVAPPVALRGRGRRDDEGDEPRLGGIGRFRRPRSQAPPPL